MNRPYHHGERGLALVAVLWLVAALSLIVTGLVASVRSETRLVSGAREGVVAGAAGDAAIHLVLQGMAAEPQPVSRLAQVQVPYRGLAIAVEVMPLNGLIDINQAPKGLLAQLFAVAGKVSPDVAENLAQSVLDTRSTKSANGRERGFDAIEDLLQVPGVDYDAYANIARLITADRPGSGKVNPMAAPEGVLLVLAGGDPARAASVAAGRDAGQAGVDTTTTLATEFTDNATTRRFRLTARVPLPQGTAVVLISRSVDMGDGAQDGLPWRTFHVEQRLDAASGRVN
mgnify:CR=1 FL=1